MTSSMDRLSGIVEEVARLRPLLLGNPHRVTYGLFFKSLYFPKDPEVKDKIVFRRLMVLLGNLLSDLKRQTESKATESGQVLLETIKRAERAAKAQGRSMYVLLCDALSIPEYLFLLHSFGIPVGNAFYAVNPSGKTATFKYLAENYLKIPPPEGEELIMRTVAQGLARKLGAISHKTFRKLDDLIHSTSEEGFKNPDEMVGALFKVVEELRRNLMKLTDGGSSVLMLADHGYDVIVEQSRLLLTHGWQLGIECASSFVPILALR